MGKAEDQPDRLREQGNDQARAALERDLSARYRSPLMAFFARRTGDFAEAEDLAQEVLMRVLQRSDLAQVDHPDAFIFKTARNLLLDRARRSEVRSRNGAELELREEAVEEISPERVIQGKQDLARAMARLGELKERTRDIFILNRLEGMRYKQIAELYGISVSAVEKHLIQAFAHMMDAQED